MHPTLDSLRNFALYIDILMFSGMENCCLIPPTESTVNAMAFSVSFIVTRECESFLLHLINIRKQIVLIRLASQQGLSFENTSVYATQCARNLEARRSECRCAFCIL